MKVSYDLDGTLFAYPTELLMFAFMLQKSGHEVGLLTGRAIWDLEKNILPMLAQNKFVPNFYIGRDFEPEEQDWDQNIKNQIWKPKMIKEYNIDIHFDDQCEGLIPIIKGSKIIKI